MILHAIELRIANIIALNASKKILEQYHNWFFSNWSIISPAIIEHTWYYDIHFVEY